MDDTNFKPLPAVELVAEKLNAQLTKVLTEALAGFEMDHKRGKKILLEAAVAVLAQHAVDGGMSVNSLLKYSGKGVGRVAKPILEAQHAALVEAQGSDDSEPDEGSDAPEEYEN